ncbi:MAG: type II toxin-antitoxin system VapC family toxin [Candidatus Eremiobacteraeota bacterium]|nr:type II toxin-antitoxin system VapC family toxin [Candidatus Eremiobacteraeota bacterium]
MTYLLDTCTFVWLASAPERLSKDATRVINNQASTLVLSDVTVWEICLKWQSGKLKLPEPAKTWCESQAGIWRLERLSITRSAMYRTTELAHHHRDPFDRLLVAQSLEENISLITPDAHIAAYPVSIIW